MEKEGSSPFRSTSVNLPNEGLSSEDIFTIELKPKLSETWQPQTVDGYTVHQLVQVSQYKQINYFQC